MAEEQLKTFINRRSQIKSRLTRFKNYFTGLPKTLREQQLVELKVRTENILSLLSEYEELHLSITNLSVDPAHETDAENFEKTYYDIISQAKCRLESTSSNSELHDIEGGLIKLPSIDLPTFYGAFENWVEFHDAFDALINKNPRLSNVHKFYYLRSAVKGEAAQTLKTLKVSSDNYTVAWDLLIKRYENKKLIVRNGIKALFEIESVSNNSHQAIQKLLNEILKIKQCLEHFEQPTLDMLLIYIVSSKFNAATRQEWETFKHADEFPTFQECLDFLENRCNLLGSLEVNKNQNILNKGGSRSHNLSKSYVGTNSSYCYYCKSTGHGIYNCESFLKLSVKMRINEVKKLGLCFNCLRNNHNTKSCTSQKCKRCKKPHNTILHIEESANCSENNIISNNQGNKGQSTNNITYQVGENPNAADINEIQISCASPKVIGGKSEVLLSTACINVFNIHGKPFKGRVLLDSGSQTNFITSEFAKKLELVTTKSNLTIGGIGHTTCSNIKYKTTLTLQSRINNYKTNITCFVLDQITNNLPTTSFNLSCLEIPSNLILADNNCNKSGKIDMLIGANLFWDLLCVGQYNLGKGKPTLQKTKLGWILGGTLDIPNKNNNSQISLLSLNKQDDDLNNNIVKFWELEEVNSKVNHLSEEEQLCERHFIKNHKRTPSGRFIVELPFKRELSELGESKHTALKRFFTLERKLNRDPVLKEAYSKFLQEYEILGHMTEINENSITFPHYFLPHHAVIKESSATTKVRVVFDASAVTTSGVSLNDLQAVGPRIQNDIQTILLRFRKHPFVITADISKMYRQILINEKQRNFQLIFWRYDSNCPVSCYKLNTVTYGTASASFLATRCIKEIAIESRASNPLASVAIEQDFYMDDLLTGSSSEADLINLQKQISELLNSAGFVLCQWTSNSKNIIKSIDASSNNLQNCVNVCDDQNNKTLGILWNPNSDFFQYNFNANNRANITKRTILSIASQIFDPLGLLGPIIVNAKLIIQYLWQLKLSWDESLPINIHTKWVSFYEQLKFIKDIKIPRHAIISNYIKLELHGFSDASEKAYGACLYIKSADQLGNSTTRLLTAKSRVAPLKSTTLPRLELCGALLLATLADKVIRTINLNFAHFYYWSDSTITLGWIQSPAKQWKTFVANRVAEISRLTNPSDWRHVASKHNPADLLSRGAEPKQLIDSNLWWHGPDWLRNESDSWPLSVIRFKDDFPEQRVFNLFSKFSNLNTLLRVAAYCLRFINNCKAKSNRQATLSISKDELTDTLNLLIRDAQETSFHLEIQDLLSKKRINRKSKILNLNPFIDDKGLLRVGGRLNQSCFSREKRHPIILSHDHKLSELIIVREHKKLLHCGANHLLAHLREGYWIIGAKNKIRKIIFNCVDCFRANPRSMNQIMGALPKKRVTPAPPFYNCGVDYAGPINIKDKKGRGCKFIKAYISVFVCFTTKAIHLDLITSASSEACLAVLRRFISRRGVPLNIYSDNGTSFVGANSEMLEFYSMLKNDSNQNKIINESTNLGTTWHFIPPRSPHFGGLWEAGVKSVKTHIKRVSRNISFTFEEYYTLLTQIEAVLNSRPLSPLSPDPNDVNPLTPSHFLIGRPLTSFPEADLQNLKENRCSTYQHIQKLKQDFWRRWSKEYIGELQNRTKWKQNYENLLHPGVLVIVKEDNLPPHKWLLGRVMETHPGADKITRVASIKSPNGSVIKRTIQLCVLPLN